MLKIAWSACFNYPVPEGHRFPMLKYDLIAEQLQYEGTITSDQLFEPSLMAESELLLTHDQSYWEKLKHLSLSASEIRRTGFALSSKLVERELCIMQGTLDAARFALQHKVGMNIAGGTHHAYANRGEGFCLLNDMAIAANVLLNENAVRQVLIVDLDVHQGNGTASIFQKKKEVFTFSMHGQSNYPLQKELSDLDLPLPDQIGDQQYLTLLTDYLSKLVDQIEPDFVFYQAGVDVLKTDKLGKLGLTREGCRQRDKFVLELCKKQSIPVAISMGGGYSERLVDIVEAHCNTFRLAQEIYF